MTFIINIYAITRITWYFHKIRRVLISHIKLVKGGCIQFQARGYRNSSVKKVRINKQPGRFLSAPELKAELQYCDHALSVIRCPSFSHFRLLLWNCWTEFNETWQEVRSQCPLIRLCFSCWSEKQDGHSGLWLAETFSTSPLKTQNGIQWNSRGSKISTFSTKIVLFGPIEKTRWPPRPLIGWGIFDFFETAEWNSTKLDKKQDHNILYQICGFFGRLEKQDYRSGLWLAETFLTSLKPLVGIQQNLTGSNTSMSVFFGLMKKPRLSPRPLIRWETFTVTLDYIVAEQT